MPSLPPGPGPLAPASPQPAPAALYLAGLAPSGRRVQAAALEGMAKILGFPDAASCPWHRLEPQHTAALRQQLTERFQPATVNRYLAALKGVLLACRRAGLMSDEARAAAADVRGVQGSDERAGRVLELDEIRRMLAACPETPIGLRDRAAIWLLVGAGLRRSEAATALAEHVTIDARGRTVAVRGKGGKIREVPIPAMAVAALQAYEQRRGPAPAGAPYLWTGDRSGQLLPVFGSDHLVYELVLSRAKAAHVTPLPTPHDFRRTFATRLVDANVPLPRVQELMGHKDIRTTERYVRSSRRWQDEKRGAVDAAFSE